MRDYETECPHCEEMLVFERDSNEILMSDDECCWNCGEEIADYVAELFRGLYLSCPIDIYPFAVR